jgi:hypothetical protein
MSLVLQSSGGGSVTLQEPVTASNLTITVPAVTATMATLTTPSFVSTIGVGGATPAASGAGITFPATMSASSDANTLDDYEEGTWTPSVGGTATYTAQQGKYTKVGRMVTVRFYMAINNIGTGSTGSYFSGLPFVPADASMGTISLYSTLTVSLTTCGCYAETNSTVYITGNASAVATTSYNGTGVFGSGSGVYGTITYFTS